MPELPGFDVWLQRDLQNRYSADDQVPPDLLALLDSLLPHQG